MNVDASQTRSTNALFSFIFIYLFHFFTAFFFCFEFSSLLAPSPSRPSGVYRSERGPGLTAGRAAVVVRGQPHPPRPRARAQPETKFSFHVTSEGKSICITSVSLYLYICCDHSCLQVLQQVRSLAAVAGKTPPLTGRNQEPGPGRSW